MTKRKYRSAGKVKEGKKDRKPYELQEKKRERELKIKTGHLQVGDCQGNDSRIDF